MLPNRTTVLTAGLLLVLLALAIAGYRYDARIMDLLYLQPSGLTWVMRVCTLYGSWLVLLPAVILGLIFAYLNLQGEFGLRLGIAAAASAVLVEVLKRVLERARPSLLQQVQASGSSFPSGHALHSVVVYGMLALMIMTIAGRYKHWPAILFLLPPLIGWSRVYLGVHWPSDVIGGWGIGLLVLGAASAGKPATPKVDAGTS
jgi:undecaprenyl-diphosphatase